MIELFVFLFLLMVWGLYASSPFLFYLLLIVLIGIVAWNLGFWWLALYVLIILCGIAAAFCEEEEDE